MRERKGFTLIELMTAVAIITVLAAIGIPGMVRYRASGQAAKCVSNLRAIQVAREACVADLPAVNNSACMQWENLRRYYGYAAATVSAPAAAPTCPVGYEYVWNTYMSGVNTPVSCRAYTADRTLYGGHTLAWKLYEEPNP